MVKSQKGVKGFAGESGGAMSLGSDAWNVADGYTKLKILKQLIYLDRYENIALYGNDDIDEEGSFDESTNNKRRETALLRYISTLRQLLGNVKFAIRQDDHPKIKRFLYELSEVSELVSGISFQQTNEISHETTFLINETHMRNCIAVLQTIKDEINVPINKAGLIFKGSDEVDLDKIMAEIEAGG